MRGGEGGKEGKEERERGGETKEGSLSTDNGCSQYFYADHLTLRYPLEISATSGQLMCHFKLVAIVGYLIRLSIESIQLEADNCITDSLTVYDSLLPIRSAILYRQDDGSLVAGEKGFHTFSLYNFFEYLYI